jgi:hypothetical protein
MPRFRVLAVLLAILIVGAVSAEAQAAKGKKHKNITYYGRVTTSGEWHLTYACGEYSYNSSWSMNAIYGKSALEDAGELDQTIGGASGQIDFNVDQLCNGSLKSGSCGVGLDSFILPVFLDKVKGGLRVDFQLSLVGVGCTEPGAHVAPYGVGFDTSTADRHSPSGFIPSKKIGKSVITVPLSGVESGTGPGRSFSGHMSGTLTLTHKKQIQTLPG